MNNTWMLYLFIMSLESHRIESIKLVRFYSEKCSFISIIGVYKLNGFNWCCLIKRNWWVGLDEAIWVFMLRNFIWKQVIDEVFCWGCWWMWVYAFHQRIDSIFCGWSTMQFNLFEDNWTYLLLVIFYLIVASSQLKYSQEFEIQFENARSTSDIFFIIDIWYIPLWL